MPMQARAAKSSPDIVDHAHKRREEAIARHERTTIALRPVRSAMPPQTGEKIAASKKIDRRDDARPDGDLRIGLTPS